MVRKGSRIYVEGSLQTRKWQDASGLDKYSTEVVLQNYGANLIIFDSKSSSETSSSYSEPQQLEHSELDDEIPF